MISLRLLWRSETKERDIAHKIRPDRRGSQTKARSGDLPKYSNGSFVSHSLARDPCSSTRTTSLLLSPFLLCERLRPNGHLNKGEEGGFDRVRERERGFGLFLQASRSQTPKNSVVGGFFVLTRLRLAIPRVALLSENSKFKPETIIPLRRSELQLKESTESRQMDCMDMDVGQVNGLVSWQASTRAGSPLR